MYCFKQCAWRLAFPVIAAMVLATGPGFASEAKLTLDDFEARTFTSSDGHVIKYRLFVPPGYDPERPIPIVIFIHGKGARGNDNLKQVRLTGAQIWARPENQKKHPCIVFAPQTNVGWGSRIIDRPSDSSKAVVEALDELEKEFNIDRSREYITGQSGGGHATWTLIARFPNRFAAAVPLCARTDTITAEKITHVPIWVFHGAKDALQPVEMSRNIVKAIEKAGGHPKYTEYPDLGHNCWDKTYNNPEVRDWLFAQKLKPR